MRERPPKPKPERPALAAALKNLGARTGPPFDYDRPPASTFPLTPAAKSALRLSRQYARGKK